MASLFSSLSSIRSKLVIPYRIRNGRLKSMFDYLEQVSDDYYAVGKDVIQDCKDRPVRASIIASFLTGSVIAFKTNPTMESYYDQLIVNQNEMVMVNPIVRNTFSYDYLFNQWQMSNTSSLRRLNLLFFSILWKADFPHSSGLYTANCKYLQPKYISYLTEKVVDIGFLGRWWILAQSLKDFDINPDEWSEKKNKEEEAKDQLQLQKHQQQS